MICQVYRLGLIEYQQAWRLQEHLAAQIASGHHPPALLLLQHPPTYTFGRQGREENLLWDRDELSRRRVAVHWTDRGGDVTYHGPGQLVGYPLLPLGVNGMRPDPESARPRLPQGDYVAYLRKLEETIILTLLKFGVGAGQRHGETGVWVTPDVPSRCKNCPPHLVRQPAKIASIGVKVDARGVSRHGFALNVAPDMSYWDGIVACGLENQNHVGLEQLVDPAPTLEAVEDALIETFGHLFGYRMLPQQAQVLRRLRTAVWFWSSSESFDTLSKSL